jgi:hypothetical protein
MFVKIETTLNTSLPLHREVLKQLFVAGSVEEQEVRAILQGGTPPVPPPPAADEMPRNTAQLSLFKEKENASGN